MLYTSSLQKHLCDNPHRQPRAFIFALFHLKKCIYLFHNVHMHSLYRVSQHNTNETFKSFFHNTYEKQKCLKLIKDELCLKDSNSCAHSCTYGIRYLRLARLELATPWLAIPGVLPLNYRVDYDYGLLDYTLGGVSFFLSLLWPRLCPLLQRTGFQDGTCTD